MAHLTRRALILGAIWLAGCSDPGGAPDAFISDGASPPDGPAAAPFIERLTTDSDPSPGSIRMNLVQWNWTRQLATDDSSGIHAVYAQLGTTDINIPADRPDPIDTTQLPPGQVFYKYKPPIERGQTWTSPAALTGQAVGVDSAAVATAGAYVYVIWRAVDSNRLRVFFRSSSDGGKTWSSPLAISDNPALVSVSPPSIATAAGGDDGKVYVVWADGRPRSVGASMATVREVYLAVSSDHGATWSPARPVSKADGFSSWTPAVAAFSNTVHVAWTDERNDLGECTLGMNPCREEEYYRRSTDSGATWGTELRLTADPVGSPRESWAPAIAAWQDFVHVTYLDKRSGFFQVYYQRSGDGGSTFGPELQITADPMYMNAARPTVAVREGDVHLSWFGFTAFEADIYYSRSLDSGSTWSPYRILTAAPAALGAARMPHIAVSPDHAAHLIWYDTRHTDAQGPKIELYYARPNG